jgi:hypothetical protein
MATFRRGGSLVYLFLDYFAKGQFENSLTIDSRRRRVVVFLKVVVEVAP